MIDVLAWMLVFAPIVPAVTAWMLLRHIRSESPSLAERALVAVRDWLVSSLCAVVALNRLREWGLPSGLMIGMLAGAMLLVSLPSAWWVYQYQRGRFR